MNRLNLEGLAAQCMTEIENFCVQHQDATRDNVLAANLEMQARLLKMQERIKKVLEDINERYRENEKILIEAGNKKSGKNQFKGAYQMGRSFFYVGSMYFRDKNMRNCPNNEDYLRRKQNNEIFPCDWELRSFHRWTHHDRLELYKGVKSQICTHLSLTRTSPKRDIFEKLTNAYEEELLAEPLEDLVEKVDSSFQIDWMQLSCYNILYRHCPKACEAYWELYMKPSINRSDFSKEELDKLMRVAEKFKYQNWEAVATDLGTNRSALQCFAYYFYNHKRFHPSAFRKWNQKNDERLLQVVKANNFNGNVNWNAVYAHFPNQLNSTVRKRLANLDPQHKSGLFTPEEDMLLLAAYNEYGGNFKFIPKHLFPNRTLDQLRTHYKEVISRRAIIQPWSSEDDCRLLEFVAEHGQSSWARCSREVFDGTHNGGSCRNRYMLIKNKFLKDPEINIEDIKRRNRTSQTKMGVSNENFLDKLEELRTNQCLKISKKRTSPIKKRRPQKTDESDFNFRELTWTIKDAASLLNDAKGGVGIKKAQKRKRSSYKPKKPKPPNAKQKRIMYKSRLRNLELRIYNCVKYSYKFRFDESPRSDFPYKWQILYPLMKALGVDGSISYDFQFLHTYNQMSCTNRYKWRKYCSLVVQAIKNEEERDQQIDEEEEQEQEQELGEEQEQNEEENQQQDQQQEPESQQSQEATKDNTCNDAVGYGYELPPTWSSLMACRSFSILSAQEFISTNQDEQDILNGFKSNEAIVGIDENPHVEIFRQRLQSLLLKTIFLSRMKLTASNDPERKPSWCERIKENTYRSGCPKRKEKQMIKEVKKEDLDSQIVENIEY